MNKLFSLGEKFLYSKGIFSTQSLKLPEFLIIGLPKCGTCWLRGNLYAHDDIFTIMREVHYFYKDFHKPLKEYSKLFEITNKKIKGEKSPYYSLLSGKRIEFIKNIIPNVRLILMLRDPIARIWSHTKWHITKTLNKDISECSDRKIKQLFNQYNSQFNYQQILDNWLDVFPKKQLQIVFFRDIRNKPKQVLKNTFKHLGVTSDVSWSKFPYSKVINKGPKDKIPNKYKKYLEKISYQNSTYYNSLIDKLNK